MRILIIKTEKGIYIVNKKERTINKTWDLDYIKGAKENLINFYDELYDLQNEYGYDLVFCTSTEKDFIDWLNQNGKFAVL